MYRRKSWLRIEPGRNQDLHIDVRRKVRARGRVVEADTGKPLRGMSVMGELAHGTPRGWADPPPDRWSFAGWGETDAQGRFHFDSPPPGAMSRFIRAGVWAYRPDSGAAWTNHEPGVKSPPKARSNRLA